MGVLVVAGLLLVVVVVVAGVSGVMGGMTPQVDIRVTPIIHRGLNCRILSP